MSSDTAPSLCGDPLAHPAQHPEDVEHRKIQASGGKRAKPGEERRALEFEGPRQRALEIDAAAIFIVLA